MAVAVPMVTVEGRFYRAVRIGCAEAALAPPGPASAGRYHRPGQPALYLSPSPEWACIAVSSYVEEDGSQRVILPVEVEAAQIIDQRDPAACAALGIRAADSAEAWRLALERGEEPPSWHSADLVRASGADGLIDPSRRIPGGWHLALFRWNDLGGSAVSLCGAAMRPPSGSAA